MLALIKLALRISTTAFDTELQMLIDDCISEMVGLGIPDITSESTDPQIKSTVIAYCKWKFGNNADKDEWRDIYHIKLGQLKSMTGYGFPAPQNAEEPEDPEDPTPEDPEEPSEPIEENENG